MKPYRLSTAATGLHHFTLLRSTSSWPWKRMTLRRQLLELDPQTSMSKLTYLLVGPMQALAFVIYTMSGRPNILSPSCFIWMTSGFYALSFDILLDHIDLVFNRLKEFHLKINPKKCLFWHQYFVSAPCVICQGNLSWPKESRKCEGLANAHECREGAFLLRTCTIIIDLFLNLHR